MLTKTQIQKLNSAQPGGKIPWSEDLMMICQSAEPHRSGRCCQCCALHYIDCTEVRCLKGQPTDDPIPPKPRPTDVFFTLHHYYVK